jgi:alpha-N-arabinofuranosidase
MDAFIDGVVATIDAVKAAGKHDKQVDISFDEWNVWYQSRFENVDKIEGIDNWPIAPRLLEDKYSVTDAVVVGGLLISLLKHADRVTSASLAQLVNVIGPIMTEPGGPAWRQTTFFPFATASRLAAGVALRVDVECARYETAAYGEVPSIDAVATWDATSGALFVQHRGETSVDLEVDVSALENVSLGEVVGMWDADRFATNTLEQPDRVGLQAVDASIADGVIRMTLPARSWVAISLT